MKSYARLPVLVSGLLGTYTAHADLNIAGVHIGIQPRINAGAMYYEYSQPSVSDQFTQESIEEFFQELGAQTAEAIASNALTAVDRGKFEVSTVLPFIGGGATVFMDRFFIDGYVQHAFETNDSASQQNNTALSFSGPLPDANLGTIESGISAFQRTNTRYDVDISRTDWSIFTGYAVTDRFAAYAGYKRAESRFQQNGTRNEILDITLADEVEFNGFSFDNAFTQRTTITSTANVKRDFEHDGPFIGATYGMPLSGWVLDGILSFNLGIAFLDGEVTENTRVTFSDGSTAERQTVLEGGSTGLSLGLSWRGRTPLDGLSYLIAISGYRYDFSGDNLKEAGAPDSDVDIEFYEAVINFQAGLAYVF